MIFSIKQHINSLFENFGTNTADQFCGSCAGAVSAPFQRRFVFFGCGNSDFTKQLRLRYQEAVQTCTPLLSSLFDEAERGDSSTTRASSEVLSVTVSFNNFQPTCRPSSTAFTRDGDIPLRISLSPKRPSMFNAATKSACSWYPQYEHLKTSPRRFFLSVQ